MTKQTFTSEVAAKGLQTSFSGSNNTMYVKGDNAKVKSYIRVCNLKGKSAFPFKVAQG